MSRRYDRLQEDVEDNAHENSEHSLSSVEENQLHHQNNEPLENENNNNNNNNTINNENNNNNNNTDDNTNIEPTLNLNNFNNNDNINYNNTIQNNNTTQNNLLREGLGSNSFNALRNLALGRSTNNNNNNNNNNNDNDSDSETSDDNTVNNTGPLSINFNNENGNTNAVINLNARDFSQSEIDSLTKVIRYLLPALIILALLFAYEHIVGIIFYIWITAVLHQANSIIKHQFIQRDQRSASTLVSVGFLLIILVLGIYLIFWQESLWMYVGFMKPSGPPLLFWDTIWVVVVSDAVIKVTSMLLKSLYMIILTKFLSMDVIGKLCSITELTSQLHRMLITVPIWIRFFTHNYFSIAFSSACTGLYLAFKLYSIYHAVTSSVFVVRQFFKRGPRYGRYVSQEEIAEYGEDECPVCRETFRNPVALRCNHIFCEECINQWLERESTCPMCRMELKPKDVKKTYTDGSTDMSVRLF